MCRNQICRSEHRSASHNKDEAELKKAQVFAILCRRHAKWHSAAIIVNRPWAESSLLSCLSLSASSYLFFSSAPSAPCFCRRCAPTSRVRIIGPKDKKKRL